MIVSEAINLLKNSELKQLFINTETSTMVGYINLGILEIYKRFSLWEAEALITMDTDVLKYKLDGIDTNVEIDLSDHSLLMILEAYDEDGDAIALNEENNISGVTTPQFHTIEVVVPVAGEQISVIYRASPKFLILDTETIPLPIQFIEALFHYVGFKAHVSIRSDIKGENNTHYIRFKASCNTIKTEGLFAQNDLSSTKFVDRGFV